MGSRRMAVIAVAALVSALGVAGPASAQTTALDVTVTTVGAIAGAPVNVIVTGRTDDTSPLYLYYEADAATCAGAQGEQFKRPNAHTFDILYPGAGDFSYTTSFTPEQAGNVRICAYLYYQRDNPGTQEPRSLVTLVVPVTIKPGTDTDGDLRPVPIDRCQIGRAHV